MCLIGVFFFIIFIEVEQFRNLNIEIRNNSSIYEAKTDFERRVYFQRRFFQLKFFNIKYIWTKIIIMSSQTRLYYNLFSYNCRKILFIEHINILFSFSRESHRCSRHISIILMNIITFFMLIAENGHIIIILSSYNYPDYRTRAITNRTVSSYAKR